MQKRLTFRLGRSGQGIGLASCVAVRVVGSVERLLESLGLGLDLFVEDMGQH